jgi:L-fuconolactonase
MEIVDGYLHCGLKKYEPIERVRKAMRGAGVARGVLVQHLGEFDNSYIGSLVAHDPTHFAGVALVDHTASDASQVLRNLAGKRIFSGVRLIAESLQSAPDLWSIAVELGLILVHYAPYGLPQTFGSLRGFLDRHPTCRMVLTHMGHPDIPEAPDFPSYQPLFDLAQHPGVYYQLSGMKMYCPYPHESLYGLIGLATERFTTSRMIWGSNYPVVGSMRDYKNDLSLLLDGRLPIAPEEIAEVAGGNARRLWFPDFPQD